MLISCEKCSTTYVLDDGLIPAQGAPVQCTRCGFVFTARRSSSPESAPKEAPAKPADPRSTMVFGSAPAPSSPPAPARSQTMVFGGQGAAPQPAPAQDAWRSAPPAAPKANQTMVFGAPPVAAAPGPAPRTTIQFGAFEHPPAPPAPATAPATSRTMIFGAEAAVPAAPPRPSTQMFGAAVAPARPPPPSAPRASQPLAFGRDGGELTPPEAAAAPAARTMVFGSAGSEEPAGKPKLTESTVRVDLGAMMREHGVSPEGEALAKARTPPEASPSVEQRHQKTQLFAMRPEAGAAESAEPADQVKARHDRTALFAMSSQAETTKPDAKTRAPPPELDPHQSARSTLPSANGPRIPSLGAPPLADPRRALRAPPDASATLPPDAPVGRTVMMYGVTGDDAQASPATVPQLPPVLESPRPLELPPEPGLASTIPFPQGFRTRQTDPGSLPAGDRPGWSSQPTADSLESVQAPGRRRTAVVVVILLLLVLGAGAAVLWKVFGRQLLGQSDALVTEGVTSALSRLRRDDTASKNEVHAAVARLLKQRPDSVEVRAVEVIALAFDFDDLRQRASRLEKRYTVLKARLPTLERGTDAASKDAAEAVRSQLSGLKQEHDTVAAQANEANQRLQGAYASLEAAAAAVDPASPSGLADLRARALVKGVFGEPEAIALAERYSQLSDTPDDWVALAVPEYIANAPTTGDSRVDALQRLSAVMGRPENSTFIRPFVLAARIHLAQEDFAAAEDQLEKVVAMRPDHDVARDLLAWAKRLGQEKRRPQD